MVSCLSTAVLQWGVQNWMSWLNLRHAWHLQGKWHSISHLSVHSGMRCLPPPSPFSFFGDINLLIKIQFALYCRLKTLLWILLPLVHIYLNLFVTGKIFCTCLFCSILIQSIFPPPNLLRLLTSNDTFQNGCCISVRAIYANDSWNCSWYGPLAKCPVSLTANCW